MQKEPVTDEAGSFRQQNQLSIEPEESSETEIIE